MPNPSQLSPSAVTIPDAELHAAEILDDANADDQPVRCVIPSEDPLLATDPLPWTPFERSAGLFYPKKGDRAVLGVPKDGPPVILEWWPNATEPDVAGEGAGGSASKDLLSNGIGMVIGTGPRLSHFARTWFVSPEEPSEFEEYDLWTKPE